MFASRKHETFIELDEDQERLFRLPPMSPGPVIVRLFDAFTTRGPNDQTIFHTGPAGDLELVLRHSHHLSKPGRHFILAESLWHDDLWRLRVRRGRGTVDPAAPTTPHRYKVELSYTSRLPILERKVPAGFFHDGFEFNWNRQQYLDVTIHAEPKKIELRVREDLRQLEGDLPTVTEVRYDDLDDNVDLSFSRGLRMTELRLDVGAGPSLGLGGNALFFSARAEFPGVTVKLSLKAHDDVEEQLPALTVEVRLFLAVVLQRLMFFPVFESNFLDRLDRDFTFPDLGQGTITFNLKQLIKEKLEAKLFQLQVKDGNNSILGEFMAPWLVGGLEELSSLSYEPGEGDVLRPDGIVLPATGKLVVRYVGRRSPPVPVLVADAAIDATAPPPPPADGAIRLFDLPDEEPDAVPGGSGAGGVTPFGSGGLTGGGGGPASALNIGALSRIDHIVVLMQENRSFDQVLGYLSREGIRPDVDGLRPPGDPRAEEEINRFDNRNFPPRRADKTDPLRVSATAWSSFDIDDPCHTKECVLRQMIEMRGFVTNYAQRLGVNDLTHPLAKHLRLVMDYFGSGDLPVFDVLVREFAFSDRWYTSHAGPTWPNRFVLMTGDLNRDRFGNIEENNPERGALIPLQQRTLFEILNERDVKWRVFEHGYSFLRLFRNFTFDTDNIVPFDDPEEGFETLARTGRLPPVSVIEPDYIEFPPGNDDHAPADMADGQNLVNKIVQTLIASPTWERTLFVITYDEHGGFYDHRPSPTDAPPLLNQAAVMGPRVPTFFISPLVERGRVFYGREDASGRRFDHTSIGATILRRFVRPRPPRVSPRLDAALDLREVLTLAQPRPRSDFSALGLPPIVARRVSASGGRLSRDQPIGLPKGNDDFHWLLAAIRLVTGQAPRPRG